MAKRPYHVSSATQRQRRVAELLRRTLAELFTNGSLKIPDIPDVSVTVSEVRVSTDLSKAIIYVLPLGGIQTEELVISLNRERGEVRRALCRNVKLKHAPKLQFVADTMFDQIEHMQRLIHRVEVRRASGQDRLT